MSAYGSIATQKTPLQLPTRWTSPGGQSIIVFHLNDARSFPHPDLLDLMFCEFNDELDRGNTYPQEGVMTREAFNAYFLSADVCIGILHPNGQSALSRNLSIETMLGSRTWKEAFVGAYYVCALSSLLVG